MLKKLSFILLIIILLIAGYFLFSERDDHRFNYMKAVPLDAVFIMEFNNFGILAEDISQNASWKELKGIPAVDEVKEQIYYLDSLASKHEIFDEIFTRSPILFSYHLSGKNKFNAIGYFHVNRLSDQKRLKNVLLNYGRHTIRDYNNQKIYQLEYQNKGDARNLFFVFSHGLCIISHSSLLIEEAIRQINLDVSFDDQEGFKIVEKTAGKHAKANIYINYASFSRLVSRFLDSKHEGDAAFLSHLAEWSELDLTIKKNAILFNGFTYIDDSVPNYLGVFQGQKPQKFEIIDILPTNASMFILLGISDLGDYFSAYKNYLEHTGKLTQYEIGISEINKSTGVNPLQMIVNLFDNEVALLYTDVKNETLENNLFSVIKTKSKSIALEQLYQVLSHQAKKDGKKVEDYIYKYRIDKELSYDIYEFPVPELMGEVFGNLFNKNNSRYFVFIDNFLVFGHSVKAISRMLYDNVLGKTLNTDIAYNELTNYLSTRSNVFVYSQLTRSKSLYQHYLEPSFCKQYEEHVKKLYAVDACAIQLNSSNDMIYNNIFFTNMSNVDQNPKTLWESALDTVVGCKPFFFTNHYTNEKEIFIQDMNNNIYLLNKAGRIFWKIKLDELINSDIYQIDFYNNGKYQLLFSTSSHIYLIDRDGNYVENYPVKLRAPSVTGISVFDYENNKNYRIFVSCEDRYVYNYNKEGKIVKGWEFEKAETEVMTKIRHFRIGIKDYIVFADKFRVYILNRRGEERVKVNGHLAVSRNNGFTLEEGKTEDDAKMAVTDTSGIVHFIYFDDGDIENLQFEKFSADHYFLYEDINADGDKDFIFLDEKALKVFNKKKKLLFDYTFDKKIEHQPLYFSFSANDRKLGVLSEMDNKIYLFNGEGQLHEGFPLEGRTLFSIAKFEEEMKHFNLIVGSKTNFLYNYVINY